LQRFTKLRFWQRNLVKLLAELAEKRRKTKRFKYATLSLRRLNTQRGFVLPTTILVLLILSVMAGSMIMQTSQGNEQILASLETQKIYNNASPAIDRGKAKIEYLFERDDRLSGDGNSEYKKIYVEDRLETLMLNVADTANDVIAKAEDPYTLPDETRIDINGDGNLDNAWFYQEDLDADGEDEVVAYSISLRLNSADGNVNIEDDDADKAAELVARTGPMSTTSGSSTLTQCSLPEVTSPDGWYPVTTASLTKNFQIDAVVANTSATNRNVTALEVQQDRTLSLGNKWGAWFLDDIDFFYPPPFNWNGAMHTEGSIYFGNSRPSNEVKIFLVSSPYSCLYTADSSEITLNLDRDIETNDITFQGQAIAASNIGTGSYGTAYADVFPGAGKAPSDTDGTRKIVIDRTTDSVNVTDSPIQYSVDPINVVTQGTFQSRYDTDPTNTTIRAGSWGNGSNKLNQRIINKNQRKPYVDDTYRADNRWGPKPRYLPADQDRTDETKTTAANYGELIDESVVGSGLYNSLTETNPDPDFPEEVGLDGYWERRAYVEGLRVIVGQRLELGNSFGWKGSNEALYPPNANVPNKALQRRTLRDNLAAVQSTAIYHVDDNPDFPSACIATTVHPGTTTTLTDSTTFEDLTITDDSGNVINFGLDIDFFNGKGTNGWEFEVPAGNLAAFTTAMNNSASDLRIALSNLAHFAGDPDGAFPPLQETSGDIVHPYPMLTMWGDFSNLRRVIDQLDNGSTYDDLSLADQTTLQTASCTLGMLAYNIQTKQAYYEQFFVNNNGGIPTSFGEHLWKLLDGQKSDCSSSNQVDEINCKSQYTGGAEPDIDPDDWAEAKYGTGTTYDRSIHAAEFYAQFTKDDYIAAMQGDPSLSAAKEAEYIKYMEDSDFIKEYLDIQADRTLGFNNAYGIAIGSDWNPVTGEIDYTKSGKTTTFKTACDPELFDQVLSSSKDYRKIALAMAFCGEPVANQRKYPALYYLFPVNQHDHIGTNTGITEVSEDDQSNTEEYVGDSYIYDGSSGVNDGYLYRVIGDDDGDGEEEDTDTGLDSIEIQPRDRTNWVLPFSTANTGIGNLITDNGTNVYVPILDKAFHNGRELMQVRTLDLDLNMLRSNTVDTETWLPDSGIIYAFREDAIREDGIARPRSTSWANCNTEDSITGTAACLMDTDLNNPNDPPVDDDTGVSPKPVDFFPDPYRRSYGFRLRNGSDISHGGVDNGISFISDNPIYIQGNFNLHQTSDGTPLEEFTQRLTSDWSNFYSRNKLDTRFANTAFDEWRPAEIIGDALTIISDNFCDGTTESAFRGNSVTNCGGNRSSFYTSLVNIRNNDNWLREDESTTSLTLPIKVDRNGDLTYNGTTYTNYEVLDTIRGLRPMSRGRNNTTVNTILVSGQLPQRANQWNGGIINYPRFLENWSRRNLYIAGAFIQVNYSNYATAPWQQEDRTWEPSTNNARWGWWDYYNPPRRRWGYDVGLQYAPAGPVASRFISVGDARSEFYEKVEADDPYIKQLRCAYIFAEGEVRRVDTNAPDCD
ncbi:MAG: hypothetical protein D6756_07630, partial [Cyanobacteria bacterium J083]